MSDVTNRQAAFVRYHDGIETPQPGEAEAIDAITAAMQGETMKVASAGSGHAVRASHAKTSAVLKGSFEIHDRLPRELRQGLFERPGVYPALVRLAQGPGEHLSDRISTHRGLALKLLGVQGAKIDGHAEDTQDFVLATGPVFPDADAAAFLKSINMIAPLSGGHETLKTLVSATAHTLNTAIKSVTGSDVPKLDFFGHAPLHPVAESYHSQVPMRYGDFVAKVALFPVAAEQVARSNETLDPGADADVFQHATSTYFRDHDAVFEFRVQLCTDLNSMPVENASKEWPENESPYVTVATLTLPKQAALSQARVQFVEEAISFRPAHSLEAHRPLGSLMRARLRVYSALSTFRQKHNGVAPVEPLTLDAVPD